MVTSSSHWSTTSSSRWPGCSLAPGGDGGVDAVGAPRSCPARAWRRWRRGPRAAPCPVAATGSTSPARVGREPGQDAGLDQARLAGARRAEHDHERLGLDGLLQRRGRAPRGRRTAPRRGCRRTAGRATGWRRPSSGGAGGSDERRGPARGRRTRPSRAWPSGHSRGVCRRPASMVAVCEPVLDVQVQLGGGDQAVAAGPRHDVALALERLEERQRERRVFAVAVAARRACRVRNWSRAS